MVEHFINLTVRSWLGKKLAFGGMIIATGAIVGSTGLAGAMPMSQGAETPTQVAICKKDFKQLGFKNVGQCVSFYDHQKGYGGNGHNPVSNGNNNKVDTNINANVKGNNNVLSIVINYFFG